MLCHYMLFSVGSVFAAAEIIQHRSQQTLKIPLQLPVPLEIMFQEIS